MCQFLFDLTAQVLATVIGGLLLTLLFFLARDKLFPLPSLSGLWTCEATTERTAYKPYEGMVLWYAVLLVQEGNRVSGSGEKIREASVQGKREYVGKSRTHIDISGYVTKRYLAPDEIVIHVRESGELRPSSSVHTLEIKRDGTMIGAFVSTIADSIGTVNWKRGNPDFESSDRT